MSVFGSSRTMASSLSASVGSFSQSVTGTIHPAVLTAMDRLDDIAPRFFLKKGQVEILTSPEDFYSVLKAKILNAKSRVFLASLYIGRSELELIQCIRTALQRNPDLRVSLLTDALRGTRESPNPCSASLMSTLSREFGDRVEIRLFHTPNLRGLRKLIVPRRLNEGWGLQHMKLYGFDDELILSGANLSRDYFSNRQDRYYLFKSSQITQYYRKIHDAIASLSYLVVPNGSPSGYALEWPLTNPAPEPTRSAIRYVNVAAQLLTPLLRPSHGMGSGRLGLEDPSNVTVVYPISQMAPLLPTNGSTEVPAVQKILDVLDTDRFSWMFTAGYFNIYPEYREKLLSSNPKHGVVLTAAPEANGFYKSAGISGYLPSAYTLLAKEFVKDIYKRNKANSIHLLEWKNGVLNQPGGWTYHAKGIWLSPPETTLKERPCVTVIGSSNFTKRSHHLDLESGGIVITRDEDLRSKMANEMDNLTKYGKEMKVCDFNSEERRVGWGVKAALYILGGML